MSCIFGIKDINMKIDHIFQLEDVRLVIESEESRAGKIEPDLVMLEENQRSLKSLDKEISLLQAKMEGVGTVRVLGVNKMRNERIYKYGFASESRLWDKK